jgi:hypothetical protein
MQWIWHSKLQAIHECSFPRTVPEEVQVRCRLGLMHLATKLGVKVQGRLTQFPASVSKFPNTPSEEGRLNL